MQILKTYNPEINLGYFTTHAPAEVEEPIARVKLYLAGVWVLKPIKIFTGSAWTSKPVKTFNGSVWR